MNMNEGFENSVEEMLLVWRKENLSELTFYPSYKFIVDGLGDGEIRTAFNDWASNIESYIWSLVERMENEVTITLDNFDAQLTVIKNALDYEGDVAVFWADFADTDVLDRSREQLTPNAIVTVSNDPQSELDIDASKARNWINSWDLDTFIALINGEKTVTEIEEQYPIED